MSYIIDAIKKQQETVEGKPLKLDGEIIMIGALDEEEKKQMIVEGQEMANIEVNVNDKVVKLGEIQDGRIIVAITDQKEYEGNFTGFWYVWRSRKIMKAFNKLTEKAQKDLKAVLKTKGLDIYLEEL